MVATRRGVRVSSPAPTNPEQPGDVQVPPSTGRRTRRITVKQAESPTRQALEDASRQLQESEGAQQLSPQTLKRCTRASRLHSPEHSCTPVGSVHEGDVSDQESSCSAMSDIELTMRRTRRTKRLVHPAGQEADVSEAESCSSAVSATKTGRSTRKKPVPAKSDSSLVEEGDAKVDPVPEKEPGSPALSESQRVTRSQRKKPSTTSSVKPQTEESEVSDAESCMSSVSGTEGPTSAIRRSTRTRGQRPLAILMHLEEVSESPRSPARRTRAARGKAATADLSEPQSCDSESGSTYSLTTPRRGRSRSAAVKAVDSDSDFTDVHSSVGSPSRGRGTPSSSRTGSGGSSRGAPATKVLLRELRVVAEKVAEQVEEKVAEQVEEKVAEQEESLLEDSVFENTVIAAEADGTLLEEDESQTVEVEEAKVEERAEGPDTADGLVASSQQEPADTEEAAKGVVVIAEEVSAMATVDQQEELPADKSAEGTSEVEMMQEAAPTAELTEPSPSVTVTCEAAAESTEEQEQEQEEVMEVAEVDARPPQGAESPGEKSAALEADPEEKMEVSAASEVEEAPEAPPARSIQVTSSQKPSVTVEADAPQQPTNITVHKTKAISLLDSSEDEDPDEDISEEEEEEEEEEEDTAEERAGPSKKHRAAEASVEGLFMIDTRPGEEVDEDYYKGSGGEQVEEEGGEDEEEFVDEEGDDDDEEEEDTNIIFSCKNPQLKEMSSRIDPGIKVKELGGLYINFGGSKSKPVSSSLQKLKEKRIQDEVMKKSLISPEFEKMDSVPPYSQSKETLKRKRRVEREKTTGDAWFNMKAPEVTAELKADLSVLKMRGSMDPKRFYKKNDRDGLPKYFQVGTVVDAPVDFYNSRLPKKARKRTMVQELLADAKFRQENKKRYQRIMAEKAAQGAGRKKKFDKKKDKFDKKKDKSNKRVKT